MALEQGTKIYPRHIALFSGKGTFVLADKLFRRIEKIHRKHSEITTKKEYRNIFRDVENVWVLVEDVGFEGSFYFKI